MSFEDDVSRFVSSIAQRKNSSKDEEKTKMYLVVPFLDLLGYDCSNPSDVHPEFTADYNKKKGEKVDYAIMKDDKPVIFIECKSAGADLDGNKDYGEQLSRYFATHDIKVGILTNGTEYRFYSDTQKENRMDVKPFFVIDFEKTVPSGYVKELEKFHKEKFNTEDILPSIEDMMIRKGILEALEKELGEEPSEEFKNFLISKVHEGRITARIVSKYSPIIIDTIKMYKTNYVTAKLQSAIDSEKLAAPQPIIEEIPEEDGIITTDEEIFGHKIIQAIASRAVSPDRIVLRDAKSYCAILFDDNNRKTICRFYFDSKKQKRLVIFEDGKEVKYDIEKVSDIYNYQDNIISVLNAFISKP
jgi:hypothetical protein